MAFLQPQSPRQPVFQAPAIVLWLIGALTAAHGLRMLASDARSQDLVYAYGLVPARYSRAFLESHMADPGTVLERAIPFVSYMGLHSDITHLGINCLWLLAFGPVVARRFGGLLFLVFFIVCGMAGAGARPYNEDPPKERCDSHGPVTARPAARLGRLVTNRAHRTLGPR